MSPRRRQTKRDKQNTHHIFAPTPGARSLISAKLCMMMIIIIIVIVIVRFYGLSKQLAFIAQLVAVHEFVQSGLEDLQ